MIFVTSRKSKSPMNNPVSPDLFSIVIFGSSGDLSHRKLLPALLSMKSSGQMANCCAMVGFSRSETTDENMRNRIQKSLLSGPEADLGRQPKWGGLAGCLHALRGDYSRMESYRKLRNLLDRIDAKHKSSGSRLFYLAVPPEIHCKIICNLAKAGLVPRGSGKAAKGWTRVIIEKPIGHDLESATGLNEEISRHLSEDQIYRIDHYLGKETVQNIAVFRFANGIFEPLWSRQYIDRIQITASETIGIESRGGFYEKAGALRDMVQNHMLQLLALVAMEPPTSLEADSIRDEKIKVLRAVRPITPGEADRFAVRGQYGPGIIDGEDVPGYRNEEGVSGNSNVETFAALRLSVDNWRWAGVPFCLRTGKRLARSVTEIAIRFAHIPHVMFRDLPEEQHHPNELVLRLQPDEGISLSFGAKAPCARLEVKRMFMDFSYKGGFGIEPPPPYERLLLDAVNGDASLFIRHDGILETWRIVQPVLDFWRERAPRNFPNYQAGSWGPPETDSLLTQESDGWRRPGS